MDEDLKLLHINEPGVLLPRKRKNIDIRLLRLELVPLGNSVCDEIGVEWSAAQPTENMSPYKAARFLSVDVWDVPSVVRKRYRTLQLRYPPEQFMNKHIDWRPSAALLSSPRARLNWFWQSGLIPVPYSTRPPSEDALWDESAAEPLLTAQKALENACRALSEC